MFGTVKAVSLPEAYLRVISMYPQFNLTQHLVSAWTVWRRAGRADWPVLVKGLVKRKSTTVALPPQMFMDVQRIETSVKSFNFSAWAERTLCERWPGVFPPIDYSGPRPPKQWQPGF